MAAERYLSRRIPDSRVGNDIGKIDKNPVPSIYVPVEIITSDPSIYTMNYPDLINCMYLYGKIHWSEKG